jgi:hypothetical protein
MPDFSFVILRINLSRKTIQEERIRPSLVDKFLGGRGLGAKILFDELAPHVDALSAENKLLFLTGPLLGTGAPWCVALPGTMGLLSRAGRMSPPICGLIMGKLNFAVPPILGE